jgi:DNA-binding CsgD family transcriptional regulator
MEKPDPIDPSTVRSAVLAQDVTQTAKSRQFQLAHLWDGLCSGAYRLADHFSSADRHYVVAEWCPVPSGPRAPLLERRLGALHSVLNGSRQKVVAYEMSISPSSVATDLQKALFCMGCALPPSRMPISLTMSACVALGPPERNFDARCTELVADSQVLHVISTERPELRLEDQLTRTEFDVLKALVEGRSYREVAAGRNASIRTVANQLASVYRRLGVSGRGELVHYIVSKL